MKKKILLFASAALLFTGCAKEPSIVTPDSGETVNVSVSTVLQSSGLTRASWDNDGNGAKVDHWIMEVYDVDGALYDRQELTDQSGLTNTFDVTLIKNQSYKFAFWADTKGSYDTDDLREVKTVSTVAGLDSRDAFFAEVDYTSNKSETLTAKLYRPFAQINVVALDLDKIYQQMVKANTTADYDKFIPNTLKLACDTYNEFNVLTGEVSDVQPAELTLASCYADYTAHAAKTTIFMDYGFAAAEKEVKDMDFSFISNGVEIAYNFTNIPVQRNYRTNISGNLLSNDATWNVEIIPIWDGEFDEEYIAAGSIKAANKALKDGETNIAIADPEDAGTHIIFPAEATGKDVTITLTGAEGKTIYFENAPETKSVTTTDGPASLTIVSDVQNLDIKCPKTDVRIIKKAGETDFPVIAAKSLSIEGETGAVLKTGTSGKSLRCESSLKDIEIKTDSSNKGTDGALNVNKSSSFDNVKFTGEAKYILVLGGNDTQMNVTNCNFANEGKGRGIMVWGGSAKINVDKTSFDNVYPFNVDGGTPVFTITNSTLNGWTSYTGSATVTFENCEFGKSTSEWEFCRPYSSTTFTKCNFSNDYKLDFGAAGITLTLTDCTVGGTTAVTESILSDDLQAQGTLILNGGTVYPVEPIVSELPVDINWQEAAGCTVSGTTATISTTAENVVIPEGVNTVNTDALYCNSTIKSLSIPSSISTLGGNFDMGGCANMTDLYIEGGSTITFHEESLVFGGGLQNVYIEKLPTSATMQGDGVHALFYDLGEDNYIFSSNTINVYLPAGWVAAGYQYKFYCCPSDYIHNPIVSVKVYEYNTESSKYILLGTGTHSTINGHGIWTPAAN